MYFFYITRVLPLPSLVSNSLTHWKESLALLWLDKNYFACWRLRTLTQELMTILVVVRLLLMTLLMLLHRRISVSPPGCLISFWHQCLRRINDKLLIWPSTLRVITTVPLTMFWPKLISGTSHLPACFELCNITKINDFFTLLIIFTMHRQEDRSQTWNENT